LLDAGIRLDRVGIGHDAVLGSLHGVNLAHLRLDR
jgi:hypothetical protein